MEDGRHLCISIRRTELYTFNLSTWLAVAAEPFCIADTGPALIIYLKDKEMEKSLHIHCQSSSAAAFVSGRLKDK
jgi:hypothetical protein